MTPPFRLIVFDADDTLRRTTVPGQPCPHTPHEWELLPRVRETLARFPWGGGLRLGIASNQDHVAYGLLAEAMARRLLADMVAAAVGPIDPPPRIELCPHAADAGCPCRKPRPGMLLAIMGHFGVPAAETLFVGNHPTDRQAAGHAGTAFAWAQALFGPPHGAAPPPTNRTPWDAVEFQRPAPPRRPPG